MCLGLLVIRALMRRAWALGSPAQCLHLDTPLPEKQNAKEIVCMCSQGKFWTIATKKPKKPPATFKEPGANVGCQEQKQHTEHAPWTQHHLRGGQNTEATAPAQPLDTSLPSPHARNKLAPPKGAREAMESVACSCSSLLQQRSQKNLA